MADIIAQEDIRDEIAEVLGGVDSNVPVYTDAKWSQDELQLWEVLSNQGEARPAGHVVQWKEVVGFTVDGDTLVNVTLRYNWRVFYPYQNDSPGGTTSQALFEKLVDDSIAALVGNRIFGLSSRVDITSIVTRQPFQVIDWQNTTHPDSSHLADFDIDVRVQQEC